MNEYTVKAKETFETDKHKGVPPEKQDDRERKNPVSQRRHGLHGGASYG